VLDNVFGLPAHPLLVHATVVVVPTAAIAVLLAALWSPFRRWAGILPLALAVTGLILDPLSTSTGESLEHRLPHSSLIERHAHLADGLLPWMLALTATAGALYVWGRAQRDRASWTRRESLRRWVPLAVSVAAVVAAAGTSVEVVLIGHSGAEAAWSHVADQPSGAHVR